MGSSKKRWKITFFRSPPCSDSRIKNPPNEFICPISQSLMADPVIVSSGQTLERNCVQVCKDFNFTPFLSNGAKLDFSTVIPNIAIKSTILNWCGCNRVDRPNPIPLNVAEKVVRAIMASQKVKPDVSETELFRSSTESNRQPSHLQFSSEESVASFSSLEETLNPDSSEEEKIHVKLKSSQVFHQEEAVKHLRQITRTDPTVRIPLCTKRLLSALGCLIISPMSVLQLNSIAALVNFSLEMVNKVKIVRSGSVPPLVEVLNCGSPESVEYAVSLIFSLSLDDQNKTAIGVLGGLRPLLHLVKSKNQRVAHESALALYHLSRVQSNQSKLVKLGAASSLLGLLKSSIAENLASCVLHILCNLAMCVEGKAALLDSNAVKLLVELVKTSEMESGVSQEKCVEVLYRLSCGSLRFRGLAKEARAVEVLSEVVERGSMKVKEKAKRVLVLIKEGDVKEKEEVEEVDWERLLLDSEVVSRCHFRLDSLGANSA